MSRHFVGLSCTAQEYWREDAHARNAFLPPVRVTSSELELRLLCEPEYMTVLVVVLQSSVH